MDAKVESTFQMWMRKLNLHSKQVSQAGQMIGLAERTSQSTFRGEREPTSTELLAMAAIRAGLPAWSPETDQEIADVRELKQIIDRAAARRGI